MKTKIKQRAHLSLSLTPCPAKIKPHPAYVHRWVCSCKWMEKERNKMHLMGSGAPLESKVLVLVSLERKTNKGRFLTIWVFYWNFLQGHCSLVWLINQDIRNINSGHLPIRQRWGLMKDWSLWIPSGERWEECVSLERQMWPHAPRADITTLHVFRRHDPFQE